MNKMTLSNDQALQAGALISIIMAVMKGSAQKGLIRRRERYTEWNRLGAGRLEQEEADDDGDDDRILSSVVLGDS